MERLIDLAAKQTGIDRIELRRRNLVPESAMPYTNPFGMVYDSGEYHDCMERVLRLGDWTGFPTRRAEAKARGKCRGIGIANYVDTATGAPREKAEMVVKPEGIVEIADRRTVSQGQGHADELCAARHRISPRRAARQHPPHHRRHRAGLGRRRRAFRPCLKARQHRHAQRVEGDHRKGHADRQPCLGGDVADLEFTAGNFTVKGHRPVDLASSRRRARRSNATTSLDEAARSAGR